MSGAMEGRDYVFWVCERKDLLHRSSSDRYCAVGRFLFACVWLGDQEARRWLDCVYRYGESGERHVDIGQAAGLAAGASCLCDGGGCGGDREGDRGKWGRDCAG